MHHKRATLGLTECHALVGVRGGAVQRDALGAVGKSNAVHKQDVCAVVRRVVIRWDDLFYQPSTAVAFVKPAGSIDDVDFENAGTKLDLKKQDQGVHV